MKMCLACIHQPWIVADSEETDFAQCLAVHPAYSTRRHACFLLVQTLEELMPGQQQYTQEGYLHSPPDMSALVTSYFKLEVRLTKGLGPCLTNRLAACMQLTDW